jgi:hypothetical protein
MSEERKERKERCQVCRFWEHCPGMSEDGGGHPLGHCHRYPPVIVHGEEDPNLAVTLPITNGDMDWCGEWQAKDAPALLPGVPDPETLRRRIAEQVQQTQQLRKLLRLSLRGG